MKFFVERYNFYNESRSRKYVSLIDTDSISTNYELENLLRTKSDKNRPQSMLAIEYNSPPWKYLKDGSWYEIDKSTLEEFKYVPVSDKEPGGAYLRARLIGPAYGIDFTRCLSTQEFATVQPQKWPMLYKAPTNLRLKVVDCGQGNWNEVLSDQDRLIYDIGASAQLNLSQLLHFVSLQQIASESRPIHIILSHWDLDHYHAILGFTQNDFQSIFSIVAPSNIPKTTTVKRVMALLSGYRVTFSTIPAAIRPPGTGNRIELCFIHQIGHYSFFRAVPGRSRNQTGIVLSVEGPNSTTVLTGDHHYDKILKAIHSHHYNISGILITPHHGGNAGKLDTNGWSIEFPALETPISVGAGNPYNHPLPSIIEKLTHLQGGISPKQTCEIGSVIYKL